MIKIFFSYDHITFKFRKVNYLKNIMIGKLLVFKIELVLNCT